MRICPCLLAIVLLSPTLFAAEIPLSPPSKLPNLAPGREWRPIWSDEFDGKTIDTSKWEVIGDSPRRDGWWTKSAVELDGEGHLVLLTNKEGDRYVSGAVRTLGKFEHAFGYWEACCKLPTHVGHWPAFWLMPIGGLPDGDGRGRDGTEIDIMEKASLKSMAQHTLHWDGYGKHHKSQAKEVNREGLNDGFHTFALWWTPDSYVFYVDGEETWRTTAGGVCQKPAYAKLTEEIGPWAGKIGSAKLPDQFVIDYVRVFEAADAQEHGAGDAAAP
jgi:beta-glucanase (GH16 family)